MNKTYDGLALFSGGLDSILAAKVVQAQGLKVKCLHYTTSFFGFPHLVSHWEKTYDLEIEAVDVSHEYAQMMANYPRYGFGSALNPCVDCKILMMKKTKELLEKYQAQFIISGEVLGQRPMSQRRDTLNVIRRDAGIKDILLRPLCAQHLDPTIGELNGLIDRSKLLNFSGRTRTPQMELAKEMGITEIPSPGGGCKLTEKENAARYWKVLSCHNPTADNFRLAAAGRQFWHEDISDVWLVMGKNKAENENIQALAKKEDIQLRINNFPSPLVLIRSKNIMNEDQKKAVLLEAGSLLASYSPKAVEFAQTGNEIQILLEENEQNCSFNVKPTRFGKFHEPIWDLCQKELKAHVKNMSSNSL